MKTKIIPFLISAAMVISPITAFAKGFSGGASGSHSSYHSQTHSNSYHSGGSFSNGTSSQSNGNTYHSGYKSASTNVTNQSRQNSVSAATPAAPSKTRSILTHAAAFGGGALLGGMLGSMFHPFGGFGGGFSLLGLLMDIVLIGIIVFIVRKLFFRHA